MLNMQAQSRKETVRTVATACSVILWGHRATETVQRSVWYEVGFERRRLLSEILPSALFRMVASTATYGIRGGKTFNCVLFA